MFLNSKKKKDLIGFEECIIIPLKTFEKLCINFDIHDNNSGTIPNVLSVSDKLSINRIDEHYASREVPPTPMDMIKIAADQMNKMKSTNILKLEADLPADLKIKLFNQAKWKESKTPISSGNDLKKQIRGLNERVNTTKQLKNIIESLPTYAQSIVEKIITQFIETHKNIVSWDTNTLEIIIDSQVIEDTNAANILRYLTLDKFMHNIENIDIPPPNGIRLFREKLISIGVPESWLNNIKEVEEKYLVDNNDNKKDLPPLLTKEKSFIGSEIDDLIGSEIIAAGASAPPELSPWKPYDDLDEKKIKSPISSRTRKKLVRWEPYNEKKRSKKGRQTPAQKKNQHSSSRRSSYEKEEEADFDEYYDNDNTEDSN